MEIKKKSVYCYGEAKTACKIVPWYATVIMCVFTPFMFLKFLRYKKRYIIFTLLYIPAIVVTFLGLYLVLSHINSDNTSRLMFLGTVLLPVGFAVVLGMILSSMITMFVLAGKQDKQVKIVEKEVLIGRGKTARMDFVDNLCRLSKERDVDGFNGAVNAAHADYEARKDIIHTKSQMRVLTQETVVAGTIVDGRQAGKNTQKELAALYKAKNFERIAELSQENRARLDVYKQYLLRNKEQVQFELEYDGASTFDGTVLQRIGWTLLCNFVTFITLGIAYPAALCWKMRWQTKHTVYNGKRLSFDGTGMQLFGKWLLWGLLTIVTLGIYGFWVAKKLEQWKAKHTHISGEYAVLGGTFDGSVFGYLGWNILTALLSILTLGIAVPFVMCWKTKWLCNHRVYDGKRMNFDGNGIQLIGKYLLWLLLTIVTLGIYGLWVQNKLLQWQASHTTLTETTECVI